MDEFIAWLETAEQQELRNILNFCVAMLTLIIEDGCSPALVTQTTDVISLIYCQMYAQSDRQPLYEWNHLLTSIDGAARGSGKQQSRGNGREG